MSVLRVIPAAEYPALPKPKCQFSPGGAGLTVTTSKAGGLVCAVGRAAGIWAIAKVVERVAAIQNLPIMGRPSHRIYRFAGFFGFVSKPYESALLVIGLLQTAFRKLRQGENTCGRDGY